MHVDDMRRLFVKPEIVPMTEGQIAALLTTTIGGSMFDRIDDLLERVEDLPERAADFGEGVTETLLSFREFAERFGELTTKQEQALDNIEYALERWGV